MAAPAAPSSVPLSLAAIYSNINLIAQTTATIKEPKASEPKWYLKIHLTPEQMLASAPPASELWEKYHVHEATMMMN
jgi:hypothetical protein